MNNDSVKEIVYEFEMCAPKSSYIKPLYGKTSRKHIIPICILLLIIAAECIAIMLFDYSPSRYIWGIIPMMIILYCAVRFIIRPGKSKKLYEKIHEAREDCYSYTFYSDCVSVKNPTVEATLNYDTAEYYTEDSERFMIVFRFNRSITIDKSQCDEEKLDFFRNLVPKENQKKAEKKTSRTLVICLLLNILYAALLAVMLGVHIHAYNNLYISEYQCTTYESFENCLNAGTIKDVVIIQDKYVEYTYTGRMEEERYYTVCTDNIEFLIQKMDSADVNWKSE